MADTVVVVRFNRFLEIAGRMADEVDAVVESTAFGIQADVQAMMAGPHSGHIYNGHQASAPGEAPAMDTGTLANSITTERDAPGEWTVYTGVEYAPYLEYGTVHMEPRPSFTPAAEAAQQDFIANVGRALAGNP